MGKTTVTSVTSVTTASLHSLLAAWNLQSLKKSILLLEKQVIIDISNLRSWDLNKFERCHWPEIDRILDGGQFSSLQSVKIRVLGVGYKDYICQTILKNFPILISQGLLTENGSR
jgi:hypothetical protein